MGESEWHIVRKYNTPGTCFEWWNDPLAQDCIVETRPFNKVSWGEVQAPSMFTVIGKRGEKKYPLVYWASPSNQVPELIPKEIMEVIKIRDYNDEKGDQAGRFLAPINDSGARLRTEIHVWVKATTQNGETRYKNIKFKPKPVHNGTPVPVPVD